MVKSIISKYKNVPVEVKASIYYTICSIVQKCIVLITLPIFTRLMTTQQYGQYSIYQSWMNIVAIFATLNLQYGSFDTAMIKFENDRDRYISSIQGIVSVLTLITLIIYIIAPVFWNDLLELPSILVLAMIVEILMSTVLTFWTNKQRFMYKYKPMIIVTLIISVASPLIGLVGVLLFEEKGIARILGNTAVYLCIGLIIYIYQLYKGKALYDKKYWTYALKFNIPLIPYYLSQMIFNQSDRIMISRMSGQTNAALYSVAYQFAVVLVFVINSINSSFVPWTYRSIKDKKHNMIKKVTNIIIIFIATMLIVLILFGPEAIAILGGSKYKDAIWVVPPVAGSLLFLFLSQLCINVMFYFEENSYLVKGSILSAVLNIVLNFILIPVFGYVVAGYTTLFSYIVFWLSNLYYMNKSCKDKIEDYRYDTLFDWKKIFIIATAFTVLIILLTFTYYTIWLRIIFVGIIGIIVLLNRNKIIEYFKLIKG